MAATIDATTSTLITKGTPTPSKPVSPAKVRNAKLPFSQELARDIESLSSHVDQLHTVLATNAPSVSQLLLKDATTGKVVAAFGDFTYGGVRYTNFLNEIHVGDPLGTNNPQNALFNANTDGSVTVGQSGWLDILDPYGGHAAWLGAQNDVLTVSGAADNGSGLVRLTVAGHTLVTGNQARVQKVGGIPNATGIWTVTVIDSSHIDLQKSVFAGTYTSGGQVDRVLQISGAVNNGSGLIRLTTAVAHTYSSGDQVNVANVGGVPNATGQWIISVVDATHIDLLSSTFAGVYSSGGTCLRYFGGMLAQTIAVGPSFSNYKLRAFADGSLQIKNATITLTSASGTILLNPNIPEISLTTSSNPAMIHLDANPPSLSLYDQSGNVVTTIEVITETAISITATSHGSPDTITAPGHTYVNGDTVFIAGAVGDTAINGYRIVENVSGSNFTMTDLSGTAINGNGTYSGGGTVSRYYAGLLAQTIAVGRSFTNYKIRAFPDGQLIVNGANISNSTITSSAISGGTISGTTAGSGSLTETGSSVLTITGGAGALLGSGTTIQVTKADATHSGYLSSSDWNTFNSAGTSLLSSVNTWSANNFFTARVGINLTGATAPLQVGSDSADATPTNLANINVRINNYNATAGNYATIEFVSKDTGGTLRDGAAIMGIFKARGATTVDSGIALLTRDMSGGTGIHLALNAQPTGAIMQMAPNAAPADADIAASQISFYLDETGNNLKVRVRYSSGTYKTGTLALV